MNSVPNTYESLASNIIQKYEEVTKLQQFINQKQQAMIYYKGQIARIQSEILKNSSNRSSLKYIPEYEETINILRDEKNSAEKQKETIESEIRQLEERQKTMSKNMSVKINILENKKDISVKGGKKRTTKKKTTKKKTTKKTTKKRTTKKRTTKK